MVWGGPSPPALGSSRRVPSFEGLEGVEARGGPDGVDHEVTWSRPCPASCCPAPVPVRFRARNFHDWHPLLGMVEEPFGVVGGESHGGLWMPGGMVSSGRRWLMSGYVACQSREGCGEPGSVGRNPSRSRGGGPVRTERRCAGE